MFGPPPGMARTRPDGSFTMSNIAAGEYRLEARATGDSDMSSASGPVYAEATSVPITVAGRDIAGLAIVTAPTATATGRVVFEGGAPAGFQPNALMVVGMADSPTGMMFGGQGRVRDDWTFELKGIVGRRTIRPMGMLGNWAVKSVTLDDRDVTDAPLDFKPGERIDGLEITLSQQMPSIAGTVRGEREPASDYVVVAFPPDSQRWGLQSRYVLKGLPPAEYLLVALEYLEAGEEGDPELLDKLRRAATTVTVGEGESKTVSLKLSPQP